MKSIVLAPHTAHLVHFLFEWSAIALGFHVYRRQRRIAGASGILQPGHYGVMIGCILGAAIGNKLMFWIEFPQLWMSAAGDFSAWMSGQSIVGGLIGGLIGVEAAKKLIGLHKSTGDNFVLPLMVGTVVGRTGCFLAGLTDGTYGNPTSAIWGVDFGDGIARHPTQLYEMAFVLVWGSYLMSRGRRWEAQPGLQFKLYLSGYLLWRLLVDGIKPVPYDYGAGLSGIQVVCLLALACYLPFTIRQFLHVRKGAFVHA